MWRGRAADRKPQGHQDAAADEQNGDAQPVAVMQVCHARVSFVHRRRFELAGACQSIVSKDQGQVRRGLQRPEDDPGPVKARFILVLEECGDQYTQVQEEHNAEA